MPHILQNDPFSPIKCLEDKNISKDERIELERSNRIMSCLVSSLLSVKQTTLVSVLMREVDIILSANIEVPLARPG